VDKGRFDPATGCGRRIFGVVERLRQGLSWERVGNGSFGKGAAMRVAPIGCFYYKDLNVIRQKAAIHVRIMHKHSEGIAGAVAQAVVVYYGYEQMPKVWLNGLANGTKGRDYVVDPVRRIEGVM
jgi:poly(ADP-ribose) glycohydrolase ARH3